jgi:hypothetical protein
VKIRLMGTPGECAAGVEVIRVSGRFDVVDVSGSYPNRGDSQLVRVYVETRTAQGPEVAR